MRCPPVDGVPRLEAASDGRPREARAIS